jgi:menaquinol-cytochrome c reductase iron-sulfur subunit
VNLADGGKSFLCPCHTSNFDFQGKPLNQVPPRPMDRLEVKLTRGADPDSEVQVKFQRFRTQSEEKIPLV